MPLTLPQEAESFLNCLAQMRAIDLDRAPEPVGTGSINMVWRAWQSSGAPVAVRLGPDPQVVAEGPSWMRSGALACEAIVLDRLGATLTGLPVPVAAGFREPSRPWLVQRWIPGTSFEEVMPIMEPGARAGIWKELGTALRKVHGISAPWFGTPDGAAIFGEWAEMVRADVEGLIADASRYGLDPAPFARLLSRVQRSAKHLRTVHPAIVHSDLGPRHVLVRQDGRSDWRISGYIDWEYARYVDPLSESILVELLARPDDDPDRCAFLDGYGLDTGALADPAFVERQEIYRGIVAGWAATDAARLEREGDTSHAG